MQKIFLFLISFLVSAPGFAALEIQHWTLDNGARVYFVENHSIPILDISIEFDAGSRREPRDKAGLAALTNAMLARGLTEGRMADGSLEPAMSEAEISDVFADIAAERGSEAGRDRAGMSLRTLAASEQREQAVALLGRLLSQPSFPQDFLERDRARTIASIKEAMTKPGPIANRALWEAMYQTHPYARQPSVESIAAITRADLVAFHARHYVANRAVIALIGAVSREQAHVIAQQLTVRLAQGAALAALPDTPAPAPSEQRISNPASQAHILLGAPFVARGDPDYFALTVGNYVLGGGSFVSRLTREVREKRGLVYSVYSFFNPLAQDGPFLVGLQTRKEQADEALALVRQTVSEWLRDGPTEQELQAAKDNLVGGFALRIDSNRKILNNMAVIGFYQLPLDYLDTWSAKVAAVSRDAVRQAFARKLRDERMHTVVVGP